MYKVGIMNSHEFELMEMPKFYQLIYELSRRFFLLNEFKCVALIVKTPYLASLIACHGAKQILMPPYGKGTCILLPIEGSENEYSHVVIDKMTVFDNQNFYWYRDKKDSSKPNHASLGIKGKPCSYIENNAIVYPTKKEYEWLGKRNITLNNIADDINSSFPSITGEKRILKNWISRPLGITLGGELTMKGLLNVSSEEKSKGIYIYRRKNKELDKHKNQIWINSVPENIKKKFCLILLSPNHANFESNVSEVNDLYAENRLLSIKNSDISKKLVELGICNQNLLKATLMKESG